MQTIAYLQSNGVALPTPTKVDVDLYDVSTGDWTDAFTGSVHFDLVWEDCVKLSCTWENVSEDIAKLILPLGKGGKVSLTYIDPITNEYRTGIFYRGNRKVTLEAIGKTKVYSISLNFIEKENPQ